MKANMELYRVYIQTDDHPHILEMIVAGDSAKDAKIKALGHVKESNPTKGRTRQTSQNNSTVLAAKKTGMHGALVVNKMPVTIYKEIMKNLKEDKKVKVLALVAPKVAGVKPKDEAA